jgi:hypothetical protein
VRAASIWFADLVHDRVFADFGSDAMYKMIKITMLGGLLAMGGCGIFRQTPSVGDPTGVVIQKMGLPRATYPDPGGGQELEYTTEPMGQYTWMAHISPDGRLASFEQVLTGETFAKIKIDQATKADVLRIIGHPAEISSVAQHHYEVWSYRYKEAGVWNSMMHVHFDGDGTVRQMLNGPDPMRDSKDGRSM